MRPNLLLVAESESILLLQHIIELEGYGTFIETGLEGAMSVLRAQRISLILLDEDLVCDPAKHLIPYRAVIEKLDTPVLLLGNDHDAVTTLGSMFPNLRIEAMPKPLAPEMLLQRIRQALRPRSNESAETLSFSGIELNPRTHRIHRDGRRVEVSPIEFQLLRHLIESPRRVFTREELLRAVWLGDVSIKPRTVDVHIARLRLALNEGDKPNLIRTVRQRGYSLDPED